MKTLGVIGGMGPMATVYFLELVTKMCNVTCDQEHIPIVMQSIPYAPDRTAYILDHTKDNPFPVLVQAGKNLKAQGADYIAIPCVTAHYFHKKLEEEIKLPVIALPSELAQEFAKRKVHTVGLLATSGTCQSGLVQQVLASYGIETISLENSEQECLMAIIYEQIKAGKEPDIDTFVSLGQTLLSRGANGLLLGCTELSLLKRDFKDRLSSQYVDVLEVLAKAAIKRSGLKLKPEYEEKGNKKYAV